MSSDTKLLRNLIFILFGHTFEYFTLGRHNEIRLYKQNWEIRELYDKNNK